MVVSDMERVNGMLRLSATDLVGHLNCGHLTQLDLAVTSDALKRPRVWDPLLEILWERGTRHEQGFVDHLISLGLGVTKIDGIGIEDETVAQTRAAMAACMQVIVQGAFHSNRWVGRADVLRRVEVPSALGPSKFCLRNSVTEPSQNVT
jgi:hypothetical protein